MRKAYYFIVIILVAIFLWIGPAFSAQEKLPKGLKEKGQGEKKESSLGLSQEELAFLENNPVIRVGNEEGWAPFDFNEHGKPMGYAIDHLELLGKKLGISFEYLNGYTWSELLELFKQGEIDLLPSLWISKSRKRYMLFTEPFIKLPYVLVISKDNKKVRDFQDLKGKSVAVAKGYKQEEILEQSYPEIKRYLVKDALEGLKAVNYGKADAYIGYRGTVDYLIVTRFFTDLKIIGEVDVPELGPQGLYISVQKDMPLLRSALQKAMDSVSNQQKVRLSRKWITVDETLYPSLNKEEKEFIRKHQVLKVDNLMGWPPFNFHENGRAKGFCIEYMDLLAEKLGLEVEYVSGPVWKDFLDMLKQGEIDLLCDVVETRQRKRYIDFTRSYFVIFSGIVIKKDREVPSSLKDLAGKKVVVPKGVYYEEILRSNYPKIKVITKKDILNCLKAVSSGQAAAGLAEKPVFDYLISKHFLLDLKSVPIMDNVHFENTPVCLGVKKGRKTLKGIVQKAMNSVTEEELKALKRKWLDTETIQEKGTRLPLTSEEREYLTKIKKVRMCAHPSWMPYEGIDEKGRHTGIISDLIQLMSKRVGVDFQIVTTKSWEQSLEYARSGKCDILTSMQKGPEKAEDFVFSKPYIESVRVIVAKDEEPYIPGMSALAGKEVGIVHGDPVEDYIKSNYPQIRMRCMPTVEGVLDLVARGGVDAGIAGLQIVSYKIHELGLYDLKIAGQTPFKKFFRIGIVKESKKLKAILDKAVDSISSQEVNRINQKWLSIKYEHGFNYVLFWEIVAVLLLLVGVFFYWNRKLSRLNTEIAKAHEELAEKSKELERLSVTDSLTGLSNRLRLEEILSQECERSQRYLRPMSVIMLDIDRFKRVNDNFGHQLGDRVLKKTAELINSQIRESDLAGRWGGEEFLIICPETDCDGGTAMAEKLRKKVAVLDVPEVGGITCSFGVAEYREGESPDNLVNKADRAMYRAKREGRNRVVCEK